MSGGRLTAEAQPWLAQREASTNTRSLHELATQHICISSHEISQYLKCNSICAFLERAPVDTVLYLYIVKRTYLQIGATRERIELRPLFKQSCNRSPRFSTLRAIYPI